jgi:hypothetical protein
MGSEEDSFLISEGNINKIGLCVVYVRVILKFILGHVFIHNKRML